MSGQARPCGVIETIGENTYFEFPFDGTTIPEYEVYTIQFTSSGLLGGEGIGIGITLDDFYSGELFLNGDERPQDLLIHYTCTTP